MQVVIVPGQRDGSVFAFMDGYSFKRVGSARRNRDRGYYKCSKSFCNARITCVNNNVVKEKNEHTGHGRDVFLRERRVVMANLKQRAETSYLPLKQIFEEETRR